MRLNEAVLVDLQELSPAKKTAAEKPQPEKTEQVVVAAPSPPAKKPAVTPAPTTDPATRTFTEAAIPDASPAAEHLTKPMPTPEPLQTAAASTGTPPEEKVPAAPIPPAKFVPAPPVRQAAEFLAVQEERLNYRISLMGMPVGNAELLAKNENGEVRISLRTQSNGAISNIYPVNDLIETRHLGNGNFIMTKIKQQEGSFTADTGFCISLREQSVLWVDRRNTRSVTEKVPTSDVMDTLSGLYYLRNKPLEVGTTETLHLYDSENYAEVPVEVLRRETIRLDNLDKVSTLVVRPGQNTGGIFRRTGDILVWLTDDEKRVPVRVETRIALGKVTAQLVSAEAR